MRQIHVLIADPNVKKYTKYNVQVNYGTICMEQRHIVSGITLDAIPRDKIQGILFNKLVIIAGALVEPEALSWILSMLRDVKDQPSGIGN